LGLVHPLDRFLFDKAVFYFGNAVENDLEEHSKSRSSKHPDKPEVTLEKKERRLAVWTRTDEQGNKKFRDPAVGR
jgi:hypothetical protein